MFVLDRRDISFQISAIDAAAGLLLDLDGTLRIGADWAPGAEALLARFSDRSVVLSNDSEHTPHDLARSFARWGQPLSPERFVLAGAVAMETLSREVPGARVFWLGSEALGAYGAAHGLKITDRDPDIVLVGRDRSLTFARLGNAVTAIARGAAFVACNADTTHPGENDQLVPETGMIVAALRAGAGMPACRFIGKPERLMFDIALGRLGIYPTDALMIGDNPHTDGEGARRAGVPFLHATRLRARQRRNRSGITMLDPH